MRIIEGTKKAGYLLAHNPGKFLKLAKAKFSPVPKSLVKRRLNGILFEFDFAYDPQIKTMYKGIYEMDTIEAMRKFLKEGDVFIDVGANIGYISAIALGLVGKAGQVHSFEPVPKYYNRLQDMAKKNSEYKIVPNHCALGEEGGKARIAVTNLSNIGWNTMVPRFMDSQTIKEIIEAPVLRLDTYIKEKALAKISLIKIDTEGFELPVLKGLSGYFEETGQRPAIICEIAPAAYPLLGSTLLELSEYMSRYGYYAFSIINPNVEIDITSLKKTANVIFISNEKNRCEGR